MATSTIQRDHNLDLKRTTVKTPSSTISNATIICGTYTPSTVTDGEFSVAWSTLGCKTSSRKNCVVATVLNKPGAVPAFVSYMWPLSTSTQATFYACFYNGTPVTGGIMISYMILDDYYTNPQ